MEVESNLSKEKEETKEINNKDEKEKNKNSNNKIIKVEDKKIHITTLEDKILDINLIKKENEKKETNLNEKQKNKYLSFTLNNKINFSNKRIITIKELSNNRIGILFVNLLSFFSSKTFKKINEINLDDNPNKNSENNENENDEEDSDDENEKVINFVELKNLELVLWTTKAKILFYKLIDSNYTLFQTINENIKQEEQKEYFHFERFYSNNKDSYTINSIYQLSNGNIVSCNTNGIKIYCKKNDKYELEIDYSMDVEVKNAIEKKLNQLILFQVNFESGGFCSRSYHCTFTYSVSLYDIEKSKSYCLNEFKETVGLPNNGISFFSNNELLFVKYGQFKFDIYDINQNMKSLNKNNEIIEVDIIKEFNNYYEEINFNKIKDAMNINFLSNYSKDLFFAKDISKTIKLYRFKNQSFEYYQDFPFSNKEIRGMISLRNNNIIMYTLNEIMVISIS